MLKGHFKGEGDIESTDITCLAASKILDNHAQGDVDYVMIDVEGFDYEVLVSLDLSRQRPHVINFESKIMEGKRPQALYRAAQFCMDNGYLVLKGRANYICIRLDAEDLARLA